MSANKFEYVFAVIAENLTPVISIFGMLPPYILTSLGRARVNSALIAADVLPLR